MHFIFIVAYEFTHSFINVPVTSFALFCFFFRVGEIFSVSYLEQLMSSLQDKSTDVCIKLKTLLKSLIEEARCPSEGGSSVSIENKMKVTGNYNNGKSADISEPPNKKPKVENGGESVTKQQESETNTEKESELQNNHLESKTIEVRNDNKTMPIFYYDIQNKKYKNLPK